MKQAGKRIAESKSLMVAIIMKVDYGCWHLELLSVSSSVKKCMDGASSEALNGGRSK